MGRRDTSRDRIVEAAARVVHVRGFQSAGLAEILRIAGVPKGSFYNHFDSKQALGLVLVERYASFLLTLLDEHLGEDGSAGVPGVQAFFHSFTEVAGRSEGAWHGDPLGNLAQEMASTDEPFRQALSQAFESFEARIARALDGRLSSPHQRARTLVALWEGYLLRAKVAGQVEPLRQFERELDALLHTWAGTPTS